MHARILFLVGIAALLLHVFAGWAWSPLAAVAGGYSAGSKGWMVGSIGLSMSWGGLVLFNLLAAPSQVVDMAQVVGALLGNAPGWTVFLISILIGSLLGALGGMLGQSLRTSNLFTS